MKRSYLAAALIALSTIGAAPAFADSDRCDVPMNEWQPRETLKQQLEGKGWQVRRIKTDDGCYEAYAIDENGKRVEAYFHPKSLKMIRSKIDD